MSVSLIVVLAGSSLLKCVSSQQYDGCSSSDDKI